MLNNCFYVGIIQRARETSYRRFVVVHQMRGRTLSVDGSEALEEFPPRFRLMLQECCSRAGQSSDCNSIWQAC
jgi:hypothetical protein